MEHTAAGERPQVEQQAQQGRPGWRHPPRERAGPDPERPALQDQQQGRAGWAERLLGAEPGRRQGGRRRDWQQARDALQRLELMRERAREPDCHRDDPAATRYHRPGREDRLRGREGR